MKSLKKIIKRLIILSSIVSLLLLSINIGFYILWNENNTLEKDKSKLSTIPRNLIKVDDNYNLEDKALKFFHENYIWGILIDDNGNIAWNENKPSDIPDSYTTQNIVDFTNWYLNDYPVDVLSHPDGIIVLGKEKFSEWKRIVEVPIDLITNLPWWMVIGALLNIIFAVLLSSILGVLLFKYLTPIVKAIQSLGNEETNILSEKGIFEDLSTNINSVSKKLKKQNIMLEKKELARSKWIAEVSHDIRTPLSLILFYSNEIIDNEDVSTDMKEKASTIQINSLRIKNLIYNLNLASKLEYDMGKFHMEKISLSRLIRENIIDLINSGMSKNHSISFSNSSKNPYFIKGNTSLLSRAFYNIVQNSIHHNPDGCNIKINIRKYKDVIIIKFSDNGIGSTDNFEEISFDSKIGKNGLGLLIVKQIINVHNGKLKIKTSPNKGFNTIICFVDK